MRIGQLLLILKTTNDGAWFVSTFGEITAYETPTLFAPAAYW